MSTWLTLIKKWGMPVLLDLSIKSSKWRTLISCAWSAGSMMHPAVCTVSVSQGSRSVCRLLLWSLLFGSVAAFWCFCTFTRSARHFVLSLQHIFYPGGAVWRSSRGASRRHFAHSHVFAWGNQLSVALLVGEGVGRAAGARPVYSPQVLLLRSFPLSGLL